MRMLLITAATVAMLCATTPAQATLWTFSNIVLDGLQETPPVATLGTGLASATLDDVTGAFFVTGTFSNLTGTSNNFHLHGPAPPGTPAGVITGLPFDFGVSSGNFGGNVVLSAANVAHVLSGQTYLNLHSTFKTGGEIRGQLVNPVPEPSTLCLTALVGIGVFGLRKRRI